MSRTARCGADQAFAFVLGRKNTDSHLRQANVDDKKGIARVENAKTITGELVRVKAGELFHQGKKGKELRVHTDKTAQMIGDIQKR